ncbi:DUF4105 domain-containing protein [Xanthomonas sp. AmX2]|uniref:Lnb N-terminal periplasmic domain-containing protein n=1 Tax=Xanthomonas sp. TaxID=29446 RepID=UPI00197D4940|nr:DUF4105 domain-containing protein [Xanthomonas sp.]MBN6149966.1 DUF4105 domain-containing protein [Xanthomonas sp.]
MRRALRIAAALAIVVASVWGGLFLAYLPHTGALVRYAAAISWVAMGGAALWGLRHARDYRVLPLIFAVGCAGLVYGWARLLPEQDRNWADDVAMTLQPQVDGSVVTLHNVRNFAWRSDSDYTPRWETRRYDLDRLVSADLALSYWMGPAIAHTLVSFGFDDGQRVVFSLEIRKERGESFSALAGFFRNFEQVMVAADERDILAVRSNVRGEDVYLYRLNIPPAQLRSLFLGYVAQARQLQRKPAFYNTATSNCTTIVFELVRKIDPQLPLDYRLLLSGYLPSYVHAQRGFVPGYALATLRARGRITERARAGGDGEDFSRRIRIGVPGEAMAGAPR